MFLSVFGPDLALLWEEAITKEFRAQAVLELEMGLEETFMAGLKDDDARWRLQVMMIPSIVDDNNNAANKHLRLLSSITFCRRSGRTSCG